MVIEKSNNRNKNKCFFLFLLTGIFDHLRENEQMDRVTVPSYRLLGEFRHSQSLNDISSIANPRKNQWLALDKVR